MSTYSDHQQRELDAESGLQMDRRVARPVDAARILHLLRVRTFEKAFNVPYDEALDLLRAALAAEYTRGAREMADKLVAQRHNRGPAGLSGNCPGGTL